jgi:hypothetical protein
LRRPTGLVENRVALLNIGKAVVEKSEHGRTDLLTEPIPRAEVLVNPHLHQRLISLGLPLLVRPRVLHDRVLLARKA